MIVSAWTGAEPWLFRVCAHGQSKSGHFPIPVAIAAAAVDEASWAVIDLLVGAWSVNTWVLSRAWSVATLHKGQVRLRESCRDSVL